MLWKATVYTFFYKDNCALLGWVLYTELVLYSGCWRMTEWPPCKQACEVPVVVHVMKESHSVLWSVLGHEDLAIQWLHVCVCVCVCANGRVVYLRNNCSCFLSSHTRSLNDGDTFSQLVFERTVRYRSLWYRRYSCLECTHSQAVIAHVKMLEAEQLQT